MPTTLGRQSRCRLFGKGGPVVTEEQMWANYEYFIKAVLPAAEEEGIRLALHPDDPPVPMLGGVARLFYRPGRLQARLSSSAETARPGRSTSASAAARKCRAARANVHEMIEYFGPKGGIAYIHFRDVKGTVPNFTECFIGEGNFDPAEVMIQLHRTGFDGFLLDDHVPKMDDDTDWNHRGRAHAIGYMQGLIRMGEYLANR